MIWIVLSILTIATSPAGLNAFFTDHVKAPIGINGLSRYNARSTVPIQSSYEVMTADEEYPRSDSTWWQIFGDENKKFMPPPEEEVKSVPNFLNVNAWRTAFVEEIEEEEEDTVPSLKEYFEGKILSAKHLENIQGLWSLMKNRGSLRHLNIEDFDRVMEALRVAYISLFGKITMRSLEVSINRARGTAAVLGELRSDVNIVLSAILSDVLAELTSDKQREQLSMRFGEDVILLSENYNKLPMFMSRKADYTDLQSENQIQMLVVTSEDYRALSIRLADRLHTMRTLRSLPLDDSERLKIAEEALNVYAPLAHRMGVMKVKGELEDLAFKHLHPDVFQSTKYTQIAANKAYHEAMEAVQLIMRNDAYLREQGVTFRLSYRIKDKYQLFLKMQRKNLDSVSQVRDALGMRIIIEDYARIAGETEEMYVQRGSDICYHLVSELRNVAGWVPAERGFKDYIKNSKENGYQSLHQYIKNKALGTNVEIQVRTEAMHSKASLGEAAHWFYKDKIYRPKLVDTKFYRHAWRSPLQTTAKSPEELICMAKVQLLQARVLVFLEDRSTVLNLSKGDTALDATFALHSDIGLTVTTIRIGGRPVPLDYVLQNGDVVTCECSPGVISVSPLWLEIVKSPSALSKIRKYFRENNKHVLVCLGLVHLLMTITLSEERIAKRFPNGLPCVNKLAEFIKIRTPMSITNFADYLERLGGASLSESTSLISSLLDIPCKDLTVSSVSLGLFWARMENKNGWEDKVMQKSLLFPILKEVLPALDLPQVEAVWADLVGIVGRTSQHENHVTNEDRVNRVNGEKVIPSSTPSPSKKVSNKESNMYQHMTESLPSALLSIASSGNTEVTETIEESLHHDSLSSSLASSSASYMDFLSNSSWQPRSVSFLSTGIEKQSIKSGFYSKNPNDSKKETPLEGSAPEGPVYPNRRILKKNYADQSADRVRSD